MILHFVLLEESLYGFSELVRTWFELRVGAILGGDDDDDKEVVLLGRRIRWTEEGIEWKADRKYRDRVIEYFGF